MAAIDTPWLASMSPVSTYKSDDGPPAPSYNPNPPTTAAFSPQSLSGASVASRQRSTIIVRKKSPLLVATPPQVTRALAYSHPFILPLNKLAGLLSWSSDDPWESFLLVAGFWASCLYGRELLLFAGPLLLVAGLILAMYSRRYSPLSSTSRTGESHGRKNETSNATAGHQKSLDEIVETLRIFTSRCNFLLEPFLALTDFLSTQRTATSATTRPALTTLFIRVFLITPIWVLLTLPPFYILTARRVILTFGTLALTWHSRPARVFRVILWRSLTVRRFCSFVTGLHFSGDGRASSTSSAGVKPPAPALPPRHNEKSQGSTAAGLSMKHRPSSPGVRFTFILYENQRRWLGLGWTSAMLAYERASWTDEHLNPAPSKDRFELPYVEGATARWRWVKGSKWRIEGGSLPTTSPPKQSSASSPSSGSKSNAAANKGDGGGWIYYDNKWNDGKRDADSWGKYTRRRKWYRDAELVEITSSTEVTPSPTPYEASALSEVEDETNAKATPSSTKEPSARRENRSTGSASLQAGNDAAGGTGDVATASASQADLSSNRAPPESGGKENTSTTTTSTTTPTKRKNWFGGGGGNSTRTRRSKSPSSSSTTTATTTTTTASIGKKSLDSTFSTHRTDPSSATKNNNYDYDDHHHLGRWKDREDEATRRAFDGLGEDAVMGLS